jgi:hypothetical protein
VYSNRDKNNLSHNLPNQIKTNKHSKYYQPAHYGITISGKIKNPKLARFYSTTNSDSSDKIFPPTVSPYLKTTLNPWFITGLTDAEGSFSVSIKKIADSRLGWRLAPVFQIALHNKDLELLKLIKDYFGGVGVIVISKNPKYQMCALKISSPEQIILKIFPHFYNYPLITQKRADYLLFKDIITKMVQKEHLKEEMLQDFVNIRASLNLGLSEILKFSFPATKPVPRPQFKLPEIPDPEWMAGGLCTKWWWVFFFERS